MRFSTSLALAALSLVSASNVADLTSDSFEEYIQDNSLVMAEFFAPWCGHCKALEPEYEAAADALVGHDIRLARIDCTEEQDLCMEYDVTGYPTLKVFKGLDHVDRYEGGRTAEDIQRFLISRSMPALRPLVTKASVDEFRAENDVFVLTHFTDKATNQTLTAVAEIFRDRIPFTFVGEADVASAFGLKSDSGLVVIKKGEDPIVFSGDLTSLEELLEFMRVESFPTFGEVGPGTYPNYVDSKIPIMFVFVETLEQRAEIESWLRPHVALLKGKANIAFLNTTLYGAHAINMNIEEEFPALVVHDIVSNKKYPHVQGSPISAKSVSKFAEDFAAGKIEPVLKSDPVPESQDGPVYVVVGSEYDNVVLDDSRDVLLEIYAPWCGHCKNLAPVYEQLGEMFADDDDIVIAKIDHTTNEIPDRIQGYPTLKFYPAGNKDEAITYEGARALQNLADFVNENRSRPKSGTEEDKDAKTDEPNHDEL